jgi:glycosyltransferase involved in cell wall biosynthesis
VTNTKYEYDHVSKYFKIGDHPSSLVRLGIDGDLYETWSPDDGTKLPPTVQQFAGQYILQVALLSSRKNQTGLLAAMAQTNTPVVFLGQESPYEASYCAKIKKMAKERGNVHFLDWADNETLLSLYGNALAHVLPSWSERPGLVSLEAAACGCRVISSNRAPIDEYLGQKAWYIDPANPKNIRSTIEIATNSATAGDLREYVLANFRWTNSARQQAQVYLDLLNN